MTLTTHAIVGAAVASVIPQHPMLGFIFGFLSHFAIDAIPHWHYRVSSIHIDPDNHLNNDMHLNKYFPFDLVKIGCDGILGITISLIFFQPFHEPLQKYILFGALGGVLPDALQFVYWKFRHEPLTTLQRFHIWIHAKKYLDHLYLWGILLQVAIIFTGVFLAKMVTVLFP